MKSKHIASFFIIICVAILPVSASVDWIVFHDITVRENGQVTVNGKWSSDEISVSTNIGLSVLPAGKESMLSGDYTYFNQTVTDENGNFSFNFKLPEENEVYHVTVNTPYGDNASELVFRHRSENSRLSVGDRVYFGSYPQSEITEVNGLVEGVDYVAVSCVSYVNTDLPPLKPFSYSQATKYYAIEPVLWRVLSSDNNGIYLLSEKILYGLPYHDKWEDVAWRESYLRRWLNNEFYQSAFKKHERQAVELNENMDSVFLLTYDDANNQLYGLSDAVKKVAKNTDYVTSVSGVFRKDRADFWWLSSTGETADKAMLVGDNGTIYENGIYVDSTYIGVRPAIRIDSDHVLFESDVVSGAYGNNDNPAVSIADGALDTHRLTIINTERNGPLLTENSVNSFVGSDVTINCVNAEDKTIACLYTDVSGKEIAYNEITADINGKLIIPTTGLYCDSKSIGNIILSDGQYYLKLWFVDKDGELPNIGSAVTVCSLRVSNAVYKENTITLSAPQNLINAPLVAAKYFGRRLTDLKIISVTASMGEVRTFENVFDKSNIEYDELHLLLWNDIANMKPLMSNNILYTQ